MRPLRSPRFIVLIAAFAAAGAGAPPAAAHGEPTAGVMARAAGHVRDGRVHIRLSVWHGDASPYAGVLAVVRSAGRRDRSCGRTGARGRLRCSVRKPTRGRPHVFVKPVGGSEMRVRFWRYRVGR